MRRDSSGHEWNGRRWRIAPLLRRAQGLSTRVLRSVSDGAKRGRWGATAALVALAAAAPLAAQQGAIAGTVVDGASLRPVESAQVFVPRTSLGVLTDEEGRYRIENVPVGPVDLHVRVIGYGEVVRTVEVRAGQTATVDFRLDISVVSLDEVVVTAVGEQRRREVGNAIGRVDAEELVRTKPSRSFEELLQGEMTGVTIRKSSGSVGTGNDLKIRGVTSITLDNTPLIYIDGARVSNANVQEGDPLNFFTGGQSGSRLNDLNPDDIESIEIVKGPSAATLYGTEAAAGVVLIRTKRGRRGDVRWTFNAEAGGTRDIADWPNVGYNPTDDPSLVLPFAKDTVYTMNLMEGRHPGIEDPFRVGLQQRYGGSVRGGTGDFDFYGSVDYRSAEGNLPANELTQWSVRANFSARPSDKVTVDVSNGYISNSTELPENDNNGSGYIGNALLGLGFNAPFERPDPNDPGAPVLTCPVAFEASRARAGADFGLPDSDLATTSDALCGSPFLSLSFDDIPLIRNRQGVERYTGSGTVTYRPFSFWTNRFTVGYDQFSEDTRELTPVVPRLIPTDSDFRGAFERFVNRNKLITLEATSSVDATVTDRLDSRTTVGVQYNSERIEGLASSGQEFPAGSPSIGNSVITNTTDFTVETRTIGIFAQQQFSWNDRLFVTPAVRFDDNSAVGENLGVQTLPRVQLSWLLSEERWFPELFDEFRLRGAWGESGVQPGSTAALAILEAISTQFEGQQLLGVTPSQPANVDLSAARSREFEAGFDASLLNGRLGLEVTYYDQTTNDDVVAADLAPSLGFPDEQFVNIGEIRSRGIEAAVDAHVLNTAGVRWDWRANVTTNDGEITQLDNAIVFGLGGSSQAHREGFPFGAYFSEPLFVDEAGEVQVGEETFLGHPTPEWEGAVSTTLSLLEGRVTLYGLLDFMAGHQLFNSTEEFRCGFVVGLCEEVLEKGPDGELTDEARIKRRAVEVGSEAPWIEDADFARLRTVSVRFELPGSWVRAFGGRSASLTLVGENLLTWTGYSGLDPELNFAGGVNATRADFLTLPPAQNFFARVSVGF